MVSKSQLMTACLLCVSLGLIAFAGYTFFLPKRPETADPITVVGFARESDCIYCVEKLLCSWNEVETRFSGEGEATLLFLVEDPSFQEGELAHLCPVPRTLTFAHQVRAFDTYHLLATPAVVLAQGERVLLTVPIFPDTDMERLYQQVETALGMTT